MYNLLGACLALSALLTINAIGSFVAAFFWRVVERFSYSWSATFKAEFLFTLRIFPPILSLIGVLLLFIPSYIVYEPFPTNEVVSLKLGILATFSFVGICLAVWRGFLAWRATKRLLTDWMSHAEALHIQGVSIPAFRVEHPFPVIAVVGVFRPKLFIASRIFDSLDNEEMTAAIEHEAGHLKVRDNFKRGLMRLCRDALMIIPSGRALDREWGQASEAAADEYAARRDPSVALDLASALVKIARMVPEGLKPTMPAGAFLIGDDSGGVAWRVKRLAQIAEESEKQKSRPVVPGMVTTGFLVTLLFITVSLASSPKVLVTMHTAVERIVSALS